MLTVPFLFREMKVEFSQFCLNQTPEYLVHELALRPSLSIYIVRWKEIIQQF